MIVTFRSDAGPIEGFERATFRVAVNDEGIGEIVGPPDVIDAIAGRVVCEVDGTAVFAWEPEDRRQEARDTEQVTLSGRGGSAVLERIIVLPVGYPNFTERTRTETGAPFAVFADLLAEAQGRGRGTALTPTWTATEDSNGQPWTETISVQLDPGTTLRTLIEQFAEVEGAEWIVRPNGNIDAAAQLGNDVADEVVLFYGRDQVSRGRTSSTREQRQAIFIEASTGVSEASNSAAASAGEIWLEAQDYADVLSRDALASKLAERLSDPQEEAEIAIVPEAGAFTKFAPGDIIGLDTGSGAPQRTRLVALTVEVEDGIDVTVEGTLITEVALRQKRIDRAIEAKADVQLAATPVIQRRHGLVTADKFLSGAVGEDVAIASENYVPGVDGWAILGNGNAEFNDAVFRGDLQSDNYVPGVSGWFLDRDGNAEFEQGDFRGVVTTEGDIIIPPGAPAPGLGTIRARSIVDAGRTIYEIGLGAFPQTDFFEAGSVFADPTDTVVVGGERQVGNTDLVGLGLAQQEGAAFLAGLKDSTQAIGPWQFVPDAVRGGTSGITLTSAPFVSDAASPLTIGTAATTTTLLTVNGRATFNQNVTIVGTTQTRNLTAEGSNTYNITDYRSISIGRDLSAARDVGAGRNIGANGAVTAGGLLSGNNVFAVGSVTAGAGVSGTEGLFTVSIETFGNLTVAGTTVVNRFDTTTLAANARIGTETGTLFRSTSSQRYKVDVQTAGPLDALLDVRAVTYHDRAQVEAGVTEPTLAFGVIAEEVDALGLTMFVDYDDEGRPDAVAYERFGVALIPHVRALADRVARLEQLMEASSG